MTAITHRSAAFELRVGDQAPSREAAGYRLSLRATEDGWSLLGPDGELVFRGLGRAARRQCLQFAREQGVLAVMG